MEKSVLKKNRVSVLFSDAALVIFLIWFDFGILFRRRRNLFAKLLHQISICNYTYWKQVARKANAHQCWLAIELIQNRVITRRLNQII